MRRFRQSGWLLVLVLAACSTTTAGGGAVADDVVTDAQLAADADADSVVPADADAAVDAQADVTSVGWTLFTYSQGGFCAPNSDCASTWTISPDGTFTAKKQGKSTNGTLSVAAAQALHAAIDPPTFLAKMKSGFTCAPPPTDVGVSFSLALFGMSYQQDVTGCAFSTGGADGPLVQGIGKIVQAY